MHAFIIRPFGTKSEINFDSIEKNLILPVLAELGITGGTTGELLHQGNIRLDMFEQLLTADLVVADISIHNANVFYELGIRHALRDKRTILIKAAGDDVPFDVRTDRYIEYDASDPLASVDELSRAVQATCFSERVDSPIFQYLPSLPAADPLYFIAVPADFIDELERAIADHEPARLQLMKAELEGLPWKIKGLRLLGHGQHEIGDWNGAKATWEVVRDNDPQDFEANLALGTIYQRLGNLVNSNQAVERALGCRDASIRHRAELRSLMARNAKTLWISDWEQENEIDAIQRSALESPHLNRSYKLYKHGNTEDRNHFYSGLNALAMATVTTELAQLQSETWRSGYIDENEASFARRAIEDEKLDLAAGVRLAIESTRAAAACRDQTDHWAEVSSADILLLTSKNPGRIGRAYKEALATAPDSVVYSAKNQLVMYRSLGILKPEVNAALENLRDFEAEAQAAAERPRVILFTGHRIDPPEREIPRFPAEKEVRAKEMIAAAISDEVRKSTNEVIGIAGAASGGDIIFHEVCNELGIPTEIFIALPKRDYITASVSDAGPDWIERFTALTDRVRPKVLADSVALPRWLRQKGSYTIWERANLWMLYNAIEKSDGKLCVIALWDGEPGDGPGGTDDMITRAKGRGAAVRIISGRELLEGHDM